MAKIAGVESWIRMTTCGRLCISSATGNCFGALALTPGPNVTANPADIGFLTLAKNYELDLTS